MYIGRKLTKDEIINSAFLIMRPGVKIDGKYYPSVRPKPPINTSFRTRARPNNWDERKKALDHEKIKKFKEDNPDCCSIATGKVKINEDEIVRETNYYIKHGGGRVVLRYKVFYIDDDGIEQSANRVEIIGVNTCGYHNDAT